MLSGKQNEKRKKTKSKLTDTQSLTSPLIRGRTFLWEKELSILIDFNIDIGVTILCMSKDTFMKKDNRPPKELRTLQAGDVREDGMVFLRYAHTAKNGEHWLTKDKFVERKKKEAQWIRDHAKNNPRYKADYIANYRKKTSNKLIHSQRSRIRHALKTIVKCDKSLGLIGCTATELKHYLESKFKNGMNWENYGREGWHVDHIKPCTAFDLTDPEEQKECFHYKNLQPLWATDNRKKGNKY